MFILNPNGLHIRDYNGIKEQGRKTDKTGKENEMKYYRLDVLENNEIITVLTTENYDEACRQYDVWAEDGKAVALFEMNI